MSCVDGSRIARVDLMVWRGGRVQSALRGHSPRCQAGDNSLSQTVLIPRAPAAFFEYLSITLLPKPPTGP